MTAWQKFELKGIILIFFAKGPERDCVFKKEKREPKEKRVVTPLISQICNDSF